MTNLVNLVKDQFSTAIIHKVASVLGTNGRETNAAVDAFLPSLLSGIISNTPTKDKASGLLDLISKNNLGAGVLDNLGDLLGGGDKTSDFLSMGSSLLSTIFGANQSSFMDKIIDLTGLGKAKSSTLMSILAPIAMSVIGKLVKSEGFNASSLLSFLIGQRSNIASAVPTGFAATPVKNTVASTGSDSSGGGMGFLKWLIPLLLIGAALFWWMNRDKGGNGDAQAKVENNKGHHDHDGHGHDGHAHGNDTKMPDLNKSTTVATGKTSSGKVVTTTATTKVGVYKIDKDGNILNEDGWIVYAAGDVRKDDAGNILDPMGQVIIPVDKIKTMTLTTVGKKSPKLSVDANGNLVDGSGKILFKKGEFKQEGKYYVDNKGNKIGFFTKLGNAIGDAAQKTAEAFKNTFSGMFAKKAEVGGTYKLTRMDFHKENNRLTYYSKPEIEGLVDAIKAHQDRGIEVRVYTNDGKNEKENRKLSEARANVVRDMMATLLGTAKGNLSFKGMGSSDAAKAGRNDVEVVVVK